jgi:hypothetical protein
MEQNMSEVTLLAVFNDIDPAADAIEKLHEAGVEDENINVISGVPVTHRMLGRPHPWTNVSRLSMGGAVIGFFVGLFLNFGTPNLYTVLVGGQYVTPIPPGLIIIFEMTMLFALLATFLGVFLDSYFPNYRPMEYVPEISDGKIAVFFKCSDDDQKKITDALEKLGAESIKTAEAQQL